MQWRDALVVFRIDIRPFGDEQIGGCGLARAGCVVERGCVPVVRRIDIRAGGPVLFDGFNVSLPRSLVN